MMRQVHSVPVRAVATALLSAALLMIAVGTAHAETADDAGLRNAAWDGRIDEVERLLDKGADPNVPDHNGWTAMHGAAERADAGILEMLLSAGGNPNLQNADGRTPLILAALFPYDELRSQLAIRYLLRFGAKPDLPDNSGRTPLFAVAINHQQPTSARDLLAAGADPNKRVFAGLTPLHAAVHSESKLSADMVQALVDGGARGDIVAAGGETPLQRFVRVGSNDGRIVDALVDAGSDVDAKNPDGESPLHTAIRNGGSSENNRVVEALLAAGANSCIKDASGYIPYNTAREGGEVHTMLANAGGSDIGCEGSEDIVADYIVDPADWPGETTARSNIRSGPGTDHDVVTTLDISTPVHVTGTVRNTDWLQVDVAGATAFVHASLVREVESLASKESVEPEGGETQGTDQVQVVTWKLPLCVDDEGAMQVLSSAMLYPALEAGVCIGIVEIAKTGTCDTRTSDCDWPCPSGDHECYASWTHLPEWPYDDYEDEASRVAAAARSDPESARADGFAKVEEYQAFLRSLEMQLEASQVDAEAQVMARVGEDADQAGLERAAQETVEEEAITAGTGSAQAGDLPSPDTCLAIEELEKVGGFTGDRPTQGECTSYDCVVVPKVTNTCETAILLHVVFVDRHIGEMAEEFGISGQMSNISRFPGHSEPETRTDWGTILPPGVTTYYGAYGPSLIGPSDTTWGVCAEYYPDSIHDASGYATCKASDKPETYWTCPDGTPVPPTRDELYEATDHLEQFQYSRGSPRERTGAFCRERE